MFLSIIAPVFAKTAMRVCFRLLTNDTNTIEVTGDIADYFAKKFGNKSDAQIAAKKIKELADKLMYSLEPLYNEGSNAASVQAIIPHVSNAIDRSINTQFLLTHNLDAVEIASVLRRRHPLPSGEFMEKEKALYHRALSRLASQLVQLSPQMLEFASLLNREVLVRLGQSNALSEEIRSAIENAVSITSQSSSDIADLSSMLRGMVTRIDTLIAASQVIAQSPASEYQYFEERYLQAIYKKLNVIEHFGEGILPGNDVHPLLSEAYVSLNFHDAVTSQHIEADDYLQALSQKEARTIILGDAGSGKSTLTRWIAMETAAIRLGLRDTVRLRQLEPGKAGPAVTSLVSQNRNISNGTPWQSRIPFLIRLRALDEKGYKFPSLDEITLLEAPAIGAPPKGWMNSVIDSGRALFLIDGIDEVPNQYRREVRAGCEAYFERRGTFVLTSRPAATQDWHRWFEQNQVNKTRINVLSRTEVRRLVYGWHTAIRLTVESSRPEDMEEQLARLDGIEEQLLSKVSTHESIASLMVNPHMCSMICALHYWRGSQIPDHLLQLCEDLCKILIEKGERSGVQVKDFPSSWPKLSYKMKRGLVQDIAIEMSIPRLVSTIDWDKAIEVTESKLEKLAAVDKQDSFRTLEDMATRSGVLQISKGSKKNLENSELEFLHNTFRDFLAAERMVESHRSVLLNQVRNPEWDEILLFACANEDDSTIGENIIEGLLSTVQTSRMLFAFKCWSVLPFKVQRIGGQLEWLERRFFPPKDEHQAKAVASLGNTAVRRLSYHQGLSVRQAQLNVMALGYINTSLASEQARLYVAFYNDVVYEALVRAINPLLIPKVFESLRLEKKFIPLHWRRQISEADLLGQKARLVGFEYLDLNSTSVKDISVLASLTRLNHLNLSRTLIKDVSALKGLTQLQHLDLSYTLIEDISVLAAFTELKYLNLSGTLIKDVSALKGLTQLQHLDLSYTFITDISELTSLSQLKRLTLSADQQEQITLGEDFPEEIEWM